MVTSRAADVIEFQVGKLPQDIGRSSGSGSAQVACWITLVQVVGYGDGAQHDGDVGCEGGGVHLQYDGADQVVFRVHVDGSVVNISVGRGLTAAKLRILVVRKMEKSEAFRKSVPRGTTSVESTSPRVQSS